MTAIDPNKPMLADESDRSSVRSLMEAMGRGDRQAAAEFVICYGPQIRRRIRGKLRVQMRRLFDSQDILSTLGRRLDGYIHRGLFEPRSEGELWSLVITIAERSVAEKARIWRALSENESGLARESAGRLESGVGLSGEDLMADGEFYHLLQQIEFEEDRQIARHWALGHSSEFIAGELGLTPELVRQRWRRIREWLRGQLAEVAE